MNKTFLRFSDLEIAKKNFRGSKDHIFINKKDVHKIAMSDKLSFGDQKDCKYSTGCKFIDGIRPLSIIFTQMSGYIKCFNETKYINIIITIIIIITIFIIIIIIIGIRGIK